MRVRMRQDRSAPSRVERFSEEAEGERGGSGGGARAVAAVHCTWAPPESLPRGPAWQLDEDELGGGSAAGAWSRALAASAGPVEKIELNGSSSAHTKHRRRLINHPSV